MSKQQNSDIRQVLNKPGISQPRPINQLVGGTLLTLEITQVQPYDRNPRKGRNPKYDDIKASIQARGIEHPVKVTQRPGMQSDQFMISGGGNTRLAILHELSKETGDPRFQSHRFIYETWKSESSNVIAHLIENNERGEMTLIDKARAIFDAKSLLEAETGDRYTNRKLVDVLKTAGLSSVYSTLINTYEFALETLYPVIPDLLAQGLGRPQINRINKLLNAAQRLWAHHNSDEVDAFESLFTALLARQNHAALSDGWQEQLQADVVREIAQGDRNAFEMIRVQLEHLLNSGDLIVVDEAATASPIPPEPNREKQEKTEAVPEPALKRSVQQSADENSAHPLHAATDSESPEADHFDEGSSAKHAQQPEKNPLFKAGILQAELYAQAKKERIPDAIGQLRKEIFTYAFELAELAFVEPDNAQCIVSVDNGAGFFIREFPTLAVTDEEPNDPKTEISREDHNKRLMMRTANCLDFLLNLSEQFSLSATAVLESTSLYPKNSLLASYHHATAIGRHELSESKPPALHIWRNLFDSQRHNALSYVYYNLPVEASCHVNQLMRDLLKKHQHLTAVHAAQRGDFNLWTMVAQS
ncbi:MAG: ParB family protein [Pseudomonadota bacterium]|nr:ParB family protein [Pseudomonadota bacterium]